MTGALRSHAAGLVCFLTPFLLLAGVAFWMSLRLSRPEAAGGTASQYLEAHYPGVRWESAQIFRIGGSVGKKWRLEYAGRQTDGRRIQANLLVDRWRPGHLSGRFVVSFDPTQILDGAWDNPSRWERETARLPPAGWLGIGAAFLLAGMLWLYCTGRRGHFRKRDALLLVLLGGWLLFALLVVEAHPGFVAACGLMYTVLGWMALTKSNLPSP